jgi:hypothetical protein
MDIYNGYVAWIYPDMSGYLLDIFSGYCFLDMSEKVSYFAQIYPRDILSYPTISNDTQRYPEISRDIQMGRTPRCSFPLGSACIVRGTGLGLGPGTEGEELQPEHPLPVAVPPSGVGSSGQTLCPGKVRGVPQPSPHRRCPFPPGSGSADVVLPSLRGPCV